MQSMRDRLRERRRKKRWRMLRLFLCAVVLVAALFYSWRYIHRPGFAFGDVTIQGSSLLKEEDIIKMGGSQPPFNLFSVSFNRVRDALEQDVRFHNTQVQYRWPATLQVYVEERAPAVYVANSYRSYLQVDFEGMVMNVTTGIPDAKAPVVAGVQCGNVYIGDKVRNPAVLNILTFLQRIDETAQAAIAEITVDNRAQVKLLMRNSFPVILGDVAKLPVKAKVFMTVFNEIKDKHVKAQYIDLTFAKPYIKLLPKKE